MSPTVLRVKGFRFYFFSREEARPHVHVQHAEGEAKFWIEPAVELHANYGLKANRLWNYRRITVSSRSRSQKLGAWLRST